MVTKTSENPKERQRENIGCTDLWCTGRFARWHSGMEMYRSKRASMGKADHLSVDHLVIYNRGNETRIIIIYLFNIPFIRSFRWVGRTFGRLIDRTSEEQLQHLWRLPSVHVCTSCRLCIVCTFCFAWLRTSNTTKNKKFTTKWKTFDESAKKTSFVLSLLQNH